MEFLLLRRIPAGAFQLGNPADEPGRLAGYKDLRAAAPECYAARPVECVSYNKIAGRAGNGLTDQRHALKYSYFTDWDEHLLREPPFMQRLRQKTGLPFRLPSEAQWEYACHAGSAAALNSGSPVTGERCKNMDALGRYWHNGGAGFTYSCGDSNGTAKAGSYQPDAWGILIA